MHHGGVVGRLPISLSWLEANLFRGGRGGLIETVAQALHYAHNPKLARSFKNHFEHHLTLNAEVSGFWRVSRSGLEDDFRGNHLAGAIVGLLGAKLSHRDGLSIAKAALLHAVAPRCVCLPAAVARGNAVAESGAGHDAANALDTAVAVARAGSSGQVKRSCGRDVDRSALAFTRGDTIRIAKAPGLHVFRGLRNRWQGRAAGGENMSLH